MLRSFYGQLLEHLVLALLSSPTVYRFTVIVVAVTYSGQINDDDDDDDALSILQVGLARSARRSADSINLRRYNICFIRVAL